jgi:ribosome recycling factor
MAAIESTRQDAAARMQKAIDNLKREFSHVRTGRANPSLFDSVKVDYYGSSLPINQVAAISIPEARLVVIQPWEKTMLPTVEKAIRSSELGLNPQNDGNVIRVPIPALSEERRQELFKSCKKLTEEARIAVRNIRRDANENLKKAEKDKDISQDEQKKALGEIQKLTDDFMKKIDSLLELKEKEVLDT